MAITVIMTLNVGRAVCSARSATYLGYSRNGQAMRQLTHTDRSSDFYHQCVIVSEGPVLHDC